MSLLLTDGRVVEEEAGSEMEVYDRACARWRVMTLEALAGQQLWSGGRARFQLRQTLPVDSPDVPLPVDPYTLGVWLGDGTIRTALICGSENDLLHITARIPYARGTHRVHKTTGVHYQSFIGLWSLLRAVGVLHDKHIPVSYQTASIRQRRALLAGLVDTDGCLSPSGQVRIVTASEPLADDIRRLVRSLGYRCGKTERPPTSRNRRIRDVRTCWSIEWTPLDGQPPGTLPRKAHARVGVQRRIGIRSITPLPASTALPPAH